MIKEWKKSIYAFGAKYKGVIMLTFFMTLICYANHAWSTNIGIDTEQYIIGLYGKDWVLQGLGRFGCYYTTMLFNMGQFNPYANGLFFLVLFSSAVLVWIYVFNLINDGKKKYCYGIFSVILISHPLWVTQFYFSLQEAAIATGFFVQALAFILLFDVLLNNRTSTERWLELGMSVICAVWAFGTYQTFAGMHLAEAAACLLLLFENMRNVYSEKEFHKIFWRRAFAVVGHFLGSFFLYQAVCKIFHWGTSNYLQIRWGTESKREIIQKLWEDFRNILFGKEVYAGWIVLIAIIVIAILIGKEILGKDSLWMKLEYIGLLFGNVICMVALNIVIGEVPADRARLTVAFSAAFLGMYVIHKSVQVAKSSIASMGLVGCVGVVIGLSIICQIDRTQTLLYTDKICNEQQYEVGNDIVKNIQQLGGQDEDTVIIIGKWDAPLNNACLKQAPIGVSSFHWDYSKKKPTSGTRRAILYLNAAFGKNYQYEISEEQRDILVEAAKDMPSYPEQGYVIQKDNIYVVKLSDFS